MDHPLVQALLEEGKGQFLPCSALFCAYQICPSQPENLDQAKPAPAWPPLSEHQEYVHHASVVAGHPKMLQLELLEPVEPVEVELLELLELLEL